MNKSTLNSLKSINARLNELEIEKHRILEAEAEMASRFETKLQVKHIDGSHVGFASDFVEAESLMHADADRRIASIIAECKRKHCKIVAANIPTSDYLIVECKVWRDKNA